MTLSPDVRLTEDRDTTLLSRHPPVISAERLPLPPGLVLAERLQVLHHVGHDALGATVVALDQVERRRLLVKVLVPLETGRSSDPHGIYRLSRVLDRVRAFEHPCNARLMGHFGDEVVRAPSMIIVAERPTGHALEELLEARVALEPEQAVAVVDRVAHLVQSAHDVGLFHLGLSPHHIHLVPDELDRVVPALTVTDLGLIDAVRRAAPRLALPLDRRTTAPEVFQPGPIDARADVYSLGALLWAVLGGRQPEIPDVNAALLHVVERSTSMRPADRYADVADFRDALQKASEGRPDDPSTEVGISSMPPLPMSPSLQPDDATDASTGGSGSRRPASGGIVGPRAVPHHGMRAVGRLDDRRLDDATPTTAPSLSAGSPSAVEDEGPGARLGWYALASVPFALAAVVLILLGLGGSFSRPDPAAPAPTEGRADDHSAGGPASAVPLPPAAQTTEPRARAEATEVTAGTSPSRSEREAPGPASSDLIDADEADSPRAEPAPERVAVRSEPSPIATRAVAEPVARSVPRPAAAPAPVRAAPSPTRVTPAPTPVAPPVDVRLVTEPAGAVVFEGEQILGNTPLTVPASASAPRDLVFWLPGHATHAVHVDGEQASVRVALTPDPDAP